MSRACTDSRENKFPSDGSRIQLFVEVKLLCMGINKSLWASMQEAAILKPETGSNLYIDFCRYRVWDSTRSMLLECAKMWKNVHWISFNGGSSIRE